MLSSIFSPRFRSTSTSSLQSTAPKPPEAPDSTVLLDVFKKFETDSNSMETSIVYKKIFWGEDIEQLRKSELSNDGYGPQLLNLFFARCNTLADQYDDVVANFLLAKMYLIGEAAKYSNSDQQTQDNYAAFYLKLAADQGYEPALDNLKTMYLEGRGISSQNIKHALALLKSMSAAGNAAAANKITELDLQQLNDADPTEEKEKKVTLATYIRLLQRGNSEQLDALIPDLQKQRMFNEHYNALRRQHGDHAVTLLLESPKSNLGRALQFVELTDALELEEKGNAEEASEIYVQLFWGGDLVWLKEEPTDYARECLFYDRYQKLVKHYGDIAASFLLAKIYLIGAAEAYRSQDLPSSNDYAAFHFKQAADQGYGPALDNLKTMYLEGRGISDQNREHALTILESIAETEGAAVAYQIAKLYWAKSEETSHDQIKDQKVALTFYEMAVKLEEEKTNYQLSPYWQLYTADLVDKQYLYGMALSDVNEEEAIRHLTSCAEKGYSDATLKLGEIYVKKLDAFFINKDYYIELALHYLELAVRQKAPLAMEKFQEFIERHDVQVYQENILKQQSVENVTTSIDTTPSTSTSSTARSRLKSFLIQKK